MENIEIYLWVYAAGWAVTSVALVEKVQIVDCIGSMISALIWPILIPARVIRKII